MSEREKGVDEIVAPYRKMISETPPLLSLLYDIDMLPKQIVTRAGAIRLAGLCEVWNVRFREAIEAAAKVAEPKTARPCDCDYCDCGNSGSARDVVMWDAEAYVARAIRALTPDHIGDANDMV